MAETNISADKITGEVIEADHVNELKSALVTTLSGRNAAGILTASQNLGSALFPWGILFADALTIDGQFIDISTIAGEANIINSGQIRSTSDQTDFIRVDGATNEATIEAATTDLVYVINGSTVILSADILLTTLTVAASGATEECLINDVTLTDQEETKFLGGENDTIPVDTMGASISGKVGQVVCLQKGSELMLAFVKSVTELTNVKRGYFFDSLGDPIVRETLANNDILTLMSLGYIFLENDAVTFEVSFLNPIYSFDTPGSPSTGQYWFDLTNKTWKRFNGSVFVIINRILIGLVIIDTANAVGSRSLDFDLAYSDLNSLSYEEFSNTTIISKDIDNFISVNANNLETRENRIIFDITTDRATGVSETASTRYYAYISQDGQRRIDIERPYKLNPFLKGYYHPYQSWRCVVSFFNDSGSDIDSVIDIDDLIDSENATETKLGTVFLPKRITVATNSGDEDHDIDFSAGNFIFDDGLGQAVATALTKRIDATFVAGTNQGGLDTGTVANNAYYHLFAIHNPATPISDFLFSTSKTSPTLPTGFTKQRRIGTVRTDGSSNIRPFDQQGDTFIYRTFIEDRSESNAPTTPTNLTLTVPPDTIAINNLFYTEVGGVNAVQILFCATNNDSLSASTTNFTMKSTIPGSTQQSYSQSSVQTKADSSSQVNIDASAAETFQVLTTGFIDWELSL